MLIRKDLPLQSTMTFFETHIKDKKMDEQIIKHIDKGDKINHKSNVLFDGLIKLLLKVFSIFVPSVPIDAAFHPA